MTTQAYDRAGLLPVSWGPIQAGNRVLDGLVLITAPYVKGAHDAEFVCVDEFAYVVEHDNEVEPGHGDGEHECCVLSVVDLRTLAVDQVIPLAASEQQFMNVKLPKGMCFVPRIIRKNECTL